MPPEPPEPPEMAVWTVQPKPPEPPAAINKFVLPLPIPVRLPAVEATGPAQDPPVPPAPTVTVNTVPGVSE